MRYLPHTDKEIEQMLSVTGHAHLEDLFSHIPDKCRYQGELNIGSPISEWALTDYFKSLGEKKQCLLCKSSFTRCR